MTINSKVFRKPDSYYRKGIHAQLVEKDPRKALVLFWFAISSGDRVDSALKEMAIVMKKLGRSNEAIETVKTFRHLCSSDSQRSLDYTLLDLCTGSGRIEDQIEVLQLMLKRIEEGYNVGDKNVKRASCQGNQVRVTVEREYARHLGNLAWAFLQRNDYKTSEEYYRKALSIEPDRNRQCNLAICLMCTDRISEAKFLLQAVRTSCPNGKMDTSYGKAFKRASELLDKIERQAKNSQLECESEVCCTPYEYIQSNSERVPNDPLGLKNGTFHSEHSFATRKYYVPSAQTRKIPKRPFTQPWRCSSPSDTRTWRKETYKDESSNCLPLRLQCKIPMDKFNGTFSELSPKVVAGIKTPAEKSPVEAVKGNRCKNIASNSKPYESMVSSSRRVSGAQRDVKGDYSADCYFRSKSAKRTYTPSFQTREIPRRPFSQHKRSPSLHKRSIHYKPVNCFPHRHQFKSLADSDHLRSRDRESKCSETEELGSVNLDRPIDSTQGQNDLDSSASKFDRKDNIPSKRLITRLSEYNTSVV